MSIVRSTTHAPKPAGGPARRAGTDGGRDADHRDRSGHRQRHLLGHGAPHALHAAARRGWETQRMTVTYRVPGAMFTERDHTVPLDHGAQGGPTISVFTREVASPEGGTDKPYLLFLQGGPGMEATRPTSPPSGWMRRALADYRVLLLDQRGTGRSTPLGSQIPGATAQDQADYLTHFRADSIVRDA